MSDAYWKRTCWDWVLVGNFRPESVIQVRLRQEIANYETGKNAPKRQSPYFIRQKQELL